MPWVLYTVLLFAPFLEQTPDEQAVEHLSKVRRIYISILTGGDAALQLRDLLMTSLHNSKQFIITEDEDKADAVLKGAGDDDVFTDTFQSSEGINARTQIGNGIERGSAQLFEQQQQPLGRAEHRRKRQPPDGGAQA